MHNQDWEGKLRLCLKKKEKKKLCIFTLFNKQTVINTEWVDFAKNKKKTTDVSFFKILR